MAEEKGNWSLERDFVAALERELGGSALVKDNYYDSFTFTRTGNNLSHPRTLGLIVKACWSLADVAAVDIDRRFNEGGVKFQPDVTCVSSSDVPILFVDFESPNSSDARIPEKDVNPFLKRREKSHSAIYFIITSLPHGPHKWELRYTAKGQYNENHKTKHNEIEQDPFAYWYRYYKDELEERLRTDPSIRFLNLDGKRLDTAPLAF